jgi:hypothetical protein
VGSLRDDGSRSGLMVKSSRAYLARLPGNSRLAGVNYFFRPAGLIVAGHAATCGHSHSDDAKRQFAVIGAVPSSRPGKKTVYSQSEARNIA